MLKVWRLGLMSYDTSLKIQQVLARRLLNAIKKGDDTENHNTILLTQHNPVFTAGIRNVLTQNEILRLQALGAQFRKTNRGGLITFHGPGQLVAYPIINLKNFKASVKWYVNALEETAIKICDYYGIQAGRSPHTGVWVGNNKIAAIGIRANRYVTTHGIAINCNNDLGWFQHIVPCGIEDKGVTSLSNEISRNVTVEEVESQLLEKFCVVFNCEASEYESKDLEEILNAIYTDLLITPGVNIKQKTLKST